MPDADVSEYPLRTCILEQFDTGVMLHAANVVSHGYKLIHIIANGTDLIELGISFFNDFHFFDDILALTNCGFHLEFETKCRTFKFMTALPCI